MIKIEFKEAQPDMRGNVSNVDYSMIEHAKYLRVMFNGMSVIKSITPYIPTQDPYIDRSFILQQLGIQKNRTKKIKNYGKRFNRFDSLRKG